MVCKVARKVVTISTYRDSRQCSGKLENTGNFRGGNANLAMGRRYTDNGRSGGDRHESQRA